MLVTMKEILDRASAGNYGVAAPNVNTELDARCALEAAEELNAPIILDVGYSANPDIVFYGSFLTRLAESSSVPVAINLDHGGSYDEVMAALRAGFTSVMVDRSVLPYEENVALTKKVVDYAHQFDVTVEGELGVLAGVEDEVSSDHHTYTDPEEVIDFATRTGCDSLAISIGTSHGAYKFTPEQCHIDPATGRMVPPPLAFEVLDAVMEKLPGFPIVLHGSSSVPQEEVETINKYGGALKAAIGIPEEELRKAAKSAVCKINIDSDSRLAMTAAIRQTFAEKPAEFDPRKYLGPARDNMEKLYKHKIINVLGSDNKLAE